MRYDDYIPLKQLEVLLTRVWKEGLQKEEVSECEEGGRG